MGRWLLPLAVGATLWTAPAQGAPADDLDCPKGTERVQTDNPYQPFQCVKQDDRKHWGLSQVTGPRGFKVKPRCPRGSRPVVNTDGRQGYRCVVSAQPSAEPELATGSEELKEEGPEEPGPAPAGEGGEPAPRLERLTERSYGRYSIPQEMAFDFPKAWHVTDGWKDSPPVIYLVYDTGRGGKQVTLSVSYAEPGQDGYQDMKVAMVKEQEFQGATIEKEAGTVAGFPARFVGVKGSSRTAYIDEGKGRYFTLNYSAPADLYDVYQPAFKRLLKSFRIERRDSRELP